MRSDAAGSARLFDVVALTATLVAALLAGCGITQPKYVDHGDGSTSTAAATELSECEKTALATFTSTMQPVVGATCATASCHQLTQVEGATLSSSDAAKNRAQLLKFTGTSAATLFDKISLSGQTHGGGDQSGALPLATIEAWTSQEAACL
jgi:hypothetical protein